MAICKVVIDISNDAFQDGNEGRELARILRNLADKYESWSEGGSHTLTDLNGNVVGVAGVEGLREES